MPLDEHMEVIDMTDEEAELALAEAFSDLARALRQDRQTHLGVEHIRDWEGKVREQPLWRDA